MSRLYNWRHIVCTVQWDAAIKMSGRTLTQARNCKPATNFVLNKMTSKFLTTSATTSFWRASMVFAFLVRRTRGEGGGWTLHRNVCKLLPNCTASQPKKQHSSGTTGGLLLSMSTSTGGRCYQVLIRCVLVGFLNLSLIYSRPSRIYQLVHIFSTWTRVFWLRVLNRQMQASRPECCQNVLSSSTHHSTL